MRISLLRNDRLHGTNVFPGHFQPTTRTSTSRETRDFVLIAIKLLTISTGTFVSWTIMQLETSTIFRIDPLQLSRLDLAQERVRCIHLCIVTHNKSCATF